MKISVEFGSIQGQDKAMSILETHIAKNKIHKTFLFSGITGVGKRRVALAFAAACSCKKTHNKTNNSENQAIKVEACGTCNSCKMIVKDQHPDVLRLDCYESIITVSEIRSLLKNVSMKPYIAQHRIVIVTKAQKMNTAASNAFLKFLEEPQGKTTIILISPSQTELIPTIVSRCQHIRFKPINSKIIKMVIQKNKPYPKSIGSAVNLAYGSLTKAMELSETNWENKRKWLISNINSLCYSEGKATFMENQHWMIFSKILSEEETTIEESLMIILSWLRDILVYNFAPAKIINIDLKEEIAAVSKKINHNTILNQIVSIQEAQKSLYLKTNIRLVLDIMLINMIELNSQNYTSEVTSY